VYKIIFRPVLCCDFAISREPNGAPVERFIKPRKFFVSLRREERAANNREIIQILWKFRACFPAESFEGRENMLSLWMKSWRNTRQFLLITFKLPKRNEKDSDMNAHYRFNFSFLATRTISIIQSLATQRTPSTQSTINQRIKRENNPEKQTKTSITINQQEMKYTLYWSESTKEKTDLNSFRFVTSFCVCI
jgi:hypothetical protein